MNDHETAIVEEKRNALLKEHKELEEVLFKRMPFKEKFHSYVFAVTLVCGAVFGLWLVGYIVYALIIKKS